MFILKKVQTNLFHLVLRSHLKPLLRVIFNDLSALSCPLPHKYPWHHSWFLAYGNSIFKVKCPRWLPVNVNISRKILQNQSSPFAAVHLATGAVAGSRGWGISIASPSPEEWHSWAYSCGVSWGTPVPMQPTCSRPLRSAQTPWLQSRQGNTRC